MATVRAPLATASALDREALQNARQHGLQGLRLGNIAGVDGVPSPLLRHWFEQQWRRQALGRLHHPEHELPGNAAALLVHAVQGNRIWP